MVSISLVAGFVRRKCSGCDVIACCRGFSTFQQDGEPLPVALQTRPKGSDSQLEGGPAEPLATHRPHWGNPDFELNIHKWKKRTVFLNFL